MTNENSPICANPSPARNAVPRSYPAAKLPNEHANTFPTTSVTEMIATGPA